MKFLNIFKGKEKDLKGIDLKIATVLDTFLGNPETVIIDDTKLSKDGGCIYMILKGLPTVETSCLKIIPTSDTMILTIGDSVSTFLISDNLVKHVIDEVRSIEDSIRNEVDASINVNREGTLDFFIREISESEIPEPTIKTVGFIDPVTNKPVYTEGTEEKK